MACSFWNIHRMKKRLKYWAVPTVSKFLHTKVKVSFLLINNWPKVKFFQKWTFYLELVNAFSKGQGLIRWHKKHCKVKAFFKVIKVSVALSMIGMSCLTQMQSVGMANKCLCNKIKCIWTFQAQFQLILCWLINATKIEPTESQCQIFVTRRVLAFISY